jgi:hypothetical protein
MTLYMVVDRQGIPENTYPWEIYIENRAVIDSSDLTLYINSLVDKTLCPQDELVVMAIAPNMCQWPHPNDPGYHSEEYEAQKQREAQRMIDQIEQHIPGFRKHIRSLIIGTPTTIERYLLKNGGAVGGPKNQIGQEMLKRLHARSEWDHLYFCGDSTVMATGAPATTVSGVGAANVILRELGLPEYDSRKFPKQYVKLVDLPFQRPAYQSDEAISDGNAYLAAAQCQDCQSPECVAGCPAGIDIPGFLRRMEAGNYIGAARLIREKNPFGEVCGMLCAADRLCQRDCYRLDFSDKSVRIAELQRWVCATVGEAEWPKVDPPASGHRVAIIGGGPSAMSCAYYLALTGCQVDILAREDQPGSALLRGSESNPQLRTAVEHDLQGMLSTGIVFRGGLDFTRMGGPKAILEDHSAIYLTEPGLANGADTLTSFFQANWKDTLDPQTGQLAGHPRVFRGEEFLMNGVSMVQAVANGRKAAMAICQFLDR